MWTKLPVELRLYTISAGADPPFASSEHLPTADLCSGSSSLLSAEPSKKFYIPMHFDSTLFYHSLRIKKVVRPRPGDLDCPSSPGRSSRLPETRPPQIATFSRSLYGAPTEALHEIGFLRRRKCCHNNRARKPARS